MRVAKKIPMCATGERRGVIITFYRPGPASDKDNAYAACKVPLDAMRRAGLIVDDSPAYIELDAYTVSAGRSRTVIVLRQL